MKNHGPSYLTGFGNYFESEALANALPKGRNSPQKPPYGLFAEQLSGSAFTAKGNSNRHIWFYRILPSVKQGPFQAEAPGLIRAPAEPKPLLPPMQWRWDPLPYPQKPTDFIAGLITYATQGSIHLQMGGAIHLYAITASMVDNYFYNADGDLLIVPQEGGLLLKTECGELHVEPNEIAVIPRGFKFQVVLLNEKARGYVCENFGQHFTLPERGPIGANGLANERDFQTPIASFEERSGSYQLITKYCGNLWRAALDHSPLDVVAWHGNYVPYKYHLKYFNTMNTVSFDHPDPSIFTVLTSPSDTPGIANIDFVIFPERWMVAEDTFRPPYYHRNIMSEFMGLIYGSYDAKEEGFLPGGASLHNGMSAHGPDAKAHQAARNMTLKPEFYQGTLAFMFESRLAWYPTEFASQTELLQTDYLDCWQDLVVNFKR